MYNKFIGYSNEIYLLLAYRNNINYYYLVYEKQILKNKIISCIYISI